MVVNRSEPHNFVTPRLRRGTRRERGLSLIELMIGLTLGMILIGAMVALFVSNNQTRSEIEKSSRQIENGRYAVQLLTDDLQLAGYFAEFNPLPLASPATKPDPCSTSVADLNAAVPLHVQGYDDQPASPLACIADFRAGTDILVIRRVATCVVGDPDCSSVTSGKAYFQASLCYPATGTPLAGKELASTTPTDQFVLDTSSVSFVLHQKDCSTAAPRRSYVTHIYFVANNNNSGDGIPTLKRAELGAGQFTIVPLVEGIENMQFEYGFTDAGKTVYTASPDGHNGCVWGACVDHWRGTFSAKVHLLSRNLQSSPGHVDQKTYELGRDKNGNPVTLGPFNDGYRRHAYNATIRLANPSIRLQ